MIVDSAELGDDEVTVAALLHDIGHVVGMEAGFPLGMNNCGIPEVIGFDMHKCIGIMCDIMLAA